MRTQKDCTFCGVQRVVEESCALIRTCGHMVKKNDRCIRKMLMEFIVDLLYADTTLLETPRAALRARVCCAHAFTGCTADEPTLLRTIFVHADQ